MALVIDMIHQVCLDADSTDKRRVAVNAVRVIIKELTSALTGQRPPLESTQLKGNITAILENDLADGLIH
jgi:hypothetical protein